MANITLRGTPTAPTSTGATVKDEPLSTLEMDDNFNKLNAAVQSVSLTNHVTGILPVANGGTGRSTSTTAYGIITAGTGATGPLNTLDTGTQGQVLVSGGSTGYPSWSTDITGNASTATTLQTPRTLWGRSFNGSSSISGNIDNAGNIGATGIVTLTSGATGALVVSGGASIGNNLTVNGVATLNSIVTNDISGVDNVESQGFMYNFIIDGDDNVGIKSKSSWDRFIFRSDDLAADRFIKLPSLTSNDTFVFENHTQTLTSKKVALSAGGTTSAPLVFTIGTNLTTPQRGAVEYDGSNLYFTPESITKRGVVPTTHQFVLSAAGSAVGPSVSNFFGSTSAIQLAASTTYSIEAYCYFLKTTSGTLTWAPTFSAAPTVAHVTIEYTPVTGFTTSLISGAMVTAEQTAQAVAAMAFSATSSLTAGVYHIAKFKIDVTTNAITNLRFNVTQSAGTITPQAGSWYTARRIATNAGVFVA